ncbi:MAG TPA: hypothetical protein VFB50_06560 [Chloroflexota bacterium]|nr:hypothetical protein [Chloroflexota bacterium]
MARRITWKGSTDEALALLHALREHCDCHVEQGRTVAPCAGHTMLARDQRAIDGLLFMRRMAARLLAEEFDAAAVVAAAVAEETAVLT